MVQIPGEHLGGNEGAQEVEVEDEGYALRIEVEEGSYALELLVAGFIGFLGGGGPGIVAPGAIDEDLAGAQIPKQGGAGLLHGGAAEHVGPIGPGLPSLPSDGGGGALRGGQVDIQ